MDDALGRDIKLIALVEKSPILFDKNRVDFRQNNKKLNTWKSIAHAIGENDEFCRHRWTYLRQKFARTKAALLSGVAAEDCTWELYPYMQFLLPYVKGRKSLNSIKANSQLPHEQSEASSSPKHEELLEGSYNDDTYNANSSESEEYTEYLTTPKCEIQEVAHKVHETNHATTSTSTNTGNYQAVSVTRSPSLVDRQTSTTRKRKRFNIPSLETNLEKTMFEVGNLLTKFEDSDSSFGNYVAVMLRETMNPEEKKRKKLEIFNILN